MDAIQFKEVNVKIAEDQDEYQTLPAHYNKSEVSMTFGFKLTEEELKEVNRTGVIFIKQLTFGNPLQPVGSTVLKSKLLEREDLGYMDGEICNRQGCKGVIKEAEKEGGCSCHIVNPPCSYCTTNTGYCEECGLEN